jgi:hypothetical protein
MLWIFWITHGYHIKYFAKPFSQNIVWPFHNSLPGSMFSKLSQNVAALAENTFSK